MQTKDHLALGRYLISVSNSSQLQKHRRAFLLGCVEPDYNKATYARGMVGHRKFMGHNAENSYSHVAKCLDDIRRDGLNSTWDYFTLGTILHYVADSFTWPHNEFWEDSLRGHVAYERSLHRLFRAQLTDHTPDTWQSPPFCPVSYLGDSHAAYRAAPRKMKTDCAYIINVCQAMLMGSLRYAPAAN